VNPHLVLLPILIPLTGAAVGLLTWRWPTVQRGWSFGALLTSFAAASALLWAAWARGPVVLQLGGWAAPFGISLVGDLLGATMAVMAQGVLVTGMIYALGCRDKCATYPAFFPLFLTLTAGLTGAFLTGDVFTLFVFAELLVSSGAILTAISDDRYGAEAAYKYFFISLFAAIFLLSAIGGLYVSYGTLNMADLAARILPQIQGAGAPPLHAAAMLLMFTFFMVKSAVVPFHFWQPDFHTAAPTAISAMLSSVVVKLGVYGFLRMTTLLFVPQAATLRGLLVVLGVAGVIFGGLAALGTHNAKRMLAYSTLAQIGFVLVGIGWGTPVTLAAAVVLMINHSLIKAALLMLAGAAASRAQIKSAAFANIAGLGKSLPFMGGLFLLGGLALAGIPPTNGFIGKLALFRGGILAGEYPALAAIGVASIITLVYVVRAFQLIWWAPAPEGAKAKPGGDRLLAPALLIGLCLLLGLWAEPLLRLANDVAAWLGDPALYIAAVLGG
jgi:multicomponent Na+:H+ antiporter subunit D